jgi:glutaminyl-tRNA synthetase
MSESQNFIREIIDNDIAAGRHKTIVTRFPPEPNGYLHIGHVKSINVNHGIAEHYQGRFHLRFDDTNPTTEDIEFVESIQRDVRWLGADWGENLFFASNYFDRLYAFAEHLVEQGKAYVCSLSEEDVRLYRGTITEAGRPSPFRERSVAENLDLFRRMKAGEFADGEHVLRAKIDMSSPNMKLRDPPIYRIKRAHHYRTKDRWCIYPLYDFTHCISDAIEGITHSLCTLEFDNNRALYNWILDALPAPGSTSSTAPTALASRPHQYEFARLNMSYTLMSKRKLAKLVADKRVSGWDDPRMPTVAGMRRRGFTPEALRNFATMVGVAKNNSMVDIGKLEFCIRDDLNHKAPRSMCVLRPLAVRLSNLDQAQKLDAPLFPPDIGKDGKRQLELGASLFIEEEDFMENPPKKFFRLSPGKEVRLRYGPIIRCDEVLRDEAGKLLGLVCQVLDDHDASGQPRKVRGTIHWADATTSVQVEVRLYDRLFRNEVASDASDLNPDSLQVLSGCRLEPGAATASVGDRFQFERQGYFCVDSTSDGKDLVFNRTVTLRDSWSKHQGDTSTSRAPRAKRQPRKPKPTASEAAAAPQPSEEEAKLRQRRLEQGAHPSAALLLAREPVLGRLFDQALAAGGEASISSRWIANEVRAAMKTSEQSLLSAAALVDVLKRVETKAISKAMAKKAIAQLVRDGGQAEEVLQAHDAGAMDDGHLAQIVAAVLSREGDALARYRAGNKKLIGFFLGQVMREAKGKADPKTTRNLLQQALDEPQA